VLNISATGAMLRVDEHLRLGTLHPFGVGTAAFAIELTARVVRTTASTEAGRWDSAVAFNAMSGETNSQIVRLLNRIVQG
jgi:hypothetical protein